MVSFLRVSKLPGDCPYILVVVERRNTSKLNAYRQRRSAIATIFRKFGSMKSLLFRFFLQPVSPTFEFWEVRVVLFASDMKGTTEHAGDCKMIQRL